jgi:hypothetical protein
MKDRNAFSGYASVLLDELATIAITKLKIDTNKDTGWPKNGSYLSRRLKQLKNSLLKAGIQVFWGGGERRTPCRKRTTETGTSAQDQGREQEFRMAQTIYESERLQMLRLLEEWMSLL